MTTEAPPLTFAPLHTHTETRPSSVTVRLLGEMDLSTTGILRAAVARLDLSHRHEVRLDLAELSFCDASGLSELLGVHRTLGRAHRACTVRGVRPNILRLMHITGIDLALRPVPL